MGAHHHLISAIRNSPHPVFKPKKPFAEYIAELKNEVAENAQCLISTEIFNEIIDFSQLELFRTVAKKVKVIVYLRRQDHFLESGYSYEVKFGNKMSFEEYCDQWRLSYRDLCNRYADVFGKENIIVRPYERQQFYGGNIFSDFLNVLGLELTSDYRLPRKNPNPSLSRDVLEYMYCINRLPLEKNEVLNFTPIILAFSGRTGKDAIFLPHNMLFQKERVALMAQYLQSNAEVACEYLGRSDGILFYEPLRESEKENDSYSGLTDERVIEITRFISDHSHFLVMVLRHGIARGLASNNPDEYQAAKTLSPVMQLKKSRIEGGMIPFVKFFYMKKQTLKRAAKQCVARFYGG